MAYSIGIDYGTLSGRAVIVDLTDGKELATAVYEYANGVIDKTLPGSNIRLEPDWALQDPADYVQVLKVTIPAVLKESGVAPLDVIGIGIDFTACTMLPTLADGTPLCSLEAYWQNPHAWVKLWKHHAAQPEANEFNRIAREKGYGKLLDRYGGKISSEWFFPKVWQILNEAPEIYAAADRMIEAADWIIWQMTGEETRNSCTAGYKAMWSKTEGFPPVDFFMALDPRLANVVDEKMKREILPLGSRAGGLTAQAADWTGLLPGTSVAVGNVDAHVAVPAATVVESRKMVMTMGTSICHLVIGDQEELVPGMCGVVIDGIILGKAGYEAGQSCVGDLFQWFREHCVPESYFREAAERKISVYKLLEEKARGLKPGANGLLALDWWNGNRSILVDAELTGLILGMTLQTRPEEIFRALIEATAYGTRLIVDTFKNNLVPIDVLVATGGLPDRNELLMQIYADVTGLEILLPDATQISAVGSAMHGAVAAGALQGGYDDIIEASHKMTHLQKRNYVPDAEAHALYTELYREYVILHDYFGRGENNVMKLLKRLKIE